MDQEIQQNDEQTQTQEQPLDEREELLKAVRDAGGTGSVDVAAEAEAAGQPPPVPPPAAEPPAPDPDARLKEILSKREASHRKTLEADDYAAQLRADAERERQRILDEARAEAERLRSQSTSNARQQYQADPTGFLRTLDDDPKNVVDTVLRQGTPEWQEMQRIKAELAQAKEDAKLGKQAVDEVSKIREERKNEIAEMRAAAIREDFLSNHANPEKAPYLHARFDSPEEVFDRCNKLCVSWQKDGLKLGVDFDKSDLVTYLENQSRERYQKLPAAQAVSAGSTTQASGVAATQGIAKQSASGSRTPTAAQGSERRTSPKPFSELTPQQQREELIAEVAAARRAIPDAHG